MDAVLIAGMAGQPYFLGSKTKDRREPCGEAVEQNIEHRLHGAPPRIGGLDVLALVPSDDLSAHEIAAAALADQGGVFNPQQQLRVD